MQLIISFDKLYASSKRTNFSLLKANKQGYTEQCQEGVIYLYLTFCRNKTRQLIREGKNTLQFMVVKEFRIP